QRMPAGKGVQSLVPTRRLPRSFSEPDPGSPGQIVSRPGMIAPVLKDYPTQAVRGARDHRKKSPFRDARGRKDTSPLRTRSFPELHVLTTIAADRACPPHAAVVVPQARMPSVARHAVDLPSIVHLGHEKALEDRPAARKARA